MNSVVGDAYTEELVKLFQQQGPLLYDGQHSLCLTSPCLHFLQKRFSALQESTGPVPVRFAELQRLQGCLAKVVSLKLIVDKQIPLPATATLNLEPFRALHTLVLKKVTLLSVTGLQRLRSQLRVLVVQRCSVGNIDDVIVRCCGDDSTSFVWNSLRELDLSNNQITGLGDSLQYVPCVERARFSHNSIGLVSQEGPTGLRSSINGGQSSASVPLMNGSGGSDVSLSEGVVCLERVTFLHLGFNKLRTVPRFASKVKYTLTTLNLRNNELDSIKGLHELDSLVELDLTDNLLIHHSTLSPLKNLHHLAVLTLEGNPLSYHTKHRVKTARNLSNLINRDAFRLEGKKLSTTEKKEISSFLTHYPGGTPLMVPSQPSTPITTPPTERVVGLENGVGGASLPERFLRARVQNNTPEEASGKKPGRKKKKSHSVVIVDFDEEESREDLCSTQEELTVGSVPLKHEAHLDKIEQVRKQLESDWIKTINPADSSSTDNSNTHITTPTTHQTTSSSQQTTPINKSTNPIQLPDKSSQKRERAEGSGRSSGRNRERRSRKKRSKRDSVTSVEAVTDVGAGAVNSEECEGEFGPKTSSPNRVSTPSYVMGEHFVVERYESDVEDDDSLSTSGRGLKRRGDEEMMIVLTERFLEEKTFRGKKIDRWDVSSLEEVSIDEKPWKRGVAGKANVLSLKFNLDRRDRRRREYVLLEEGNNDKLLELLSPIVEQNKATLSVENKLECLHCQRVFDKSQALDEPSTEATPLPLGSYKNRSLSKLMCPHCHSQLLQIASFRSKPSQFGQSFSPSPHRKVLTTPPGYTHPNVVTPTNQPKSGFDITPPLDPSNETSLSSTMNLERNTNTEVLHSTGHSPDHSLEFDFESDGPTNSPPEGGLPEEGVVTAMFPWNTHKSPPLERSMSRPRAGAISESWDPGTKLEENFERHAHLHERTSPKREGTNPPNLFDELSAALSSTYDSKRDRYFDDMVSNLPELQGSTSVPPESKFHGYMGGKESTKRQPPESHGHNRSKSVDCHPRRTLNTTPPSPRKKYSDLSEDSHTHSLGSVKEGETLGYTSQSSSKKGSLASLDDRGSSSGRPEGESPSYGSSSGESGRSKVNSRTTPSGGKAEWCEKLFSSSERISHRHTTGGRVQQVRSHDNMRRKLESGKVGGTGSSSEERRHASLTLYKDEDPSYIDSNLNLYLDMDVFNLDKREEFRMVFRTPVVQYGHSKEMPALVVVSNLSLYIFRVTAPEHLEPNKWLELKSNHLLRRLVYIDIGVGYQFLRVEFRAELACYTFLLRDEEKCTLISTKLAFIVSDVVKSSFKTVGVCPFSLDHIRYPKRALREVLMVNYELLSGRSTPTKDRTTPTRGLSLGGGSRPGSSLGRNHDDDELVLYRLVHKRMSPRSQAPGPTPVTLVVTKTTVFLARENFSQWPLPRIQELPPRDSLKPPYSDVQQRSITDIEQLVLDTDQPTQVTIRFFKENVLEGEDRYWSLVMWRVSCVSKLVSSIKTLWKESFQLDLPIIHK